MKFIPIIIITISLFVSSLAYSQVTVNIGSPPQWGPVGHNDVRYYYIPDVESYYDVHRSVFIYNQNGVWVERAYLPSRYRGYDLYSGYKVVMLDYRGNAPYTFYKEHKIKYYKGYHGEHQESIGKNPGHQNQSQNHANGRPPQEHQDNRPKSNSHHEQGNSNSHANHSEHGGGKGKKH